MKNKNAWLSVVGVVASMHALAEDQPQTLPSIRVQDAESDEGVRTSEATAGVLGELPLIEAPYTVNVINEHLLEIQQSTRYADYLKNVPAANVGNVAIGFFSLRGFSVGTDGYLSRCTSKRFSCRVRCTSATTVDCRSRCSGPCSTSSPSRGLRCRCR